MEIFILLDPYGLTHLIQRTLEEADFEKQAWLFPLVNLISTEIINPGDVMGDTLSPKVQRQIRLSGKMEINVNAKRREVVQTKHQKYFDLYWLEYKRHA